MAKSEPNEKLNKTLLRKVRNKILRVPEAYNQGTWGMRAQTPCGTKACIAGHALIESGFCTPLELVRGARETPDGTDYFSVEDEAVELLGLNYDESSVLFDEDGEGWPEPFESRFRGARTKEAKARVAADYINHIIRTGDVL